ncbi:hypothetical protein HGRIS_007359 [Hohenbuehelia grisea]|uniref:Uncharacterized protein n=1 Tax=Hohenbuehelia grisea TaxID=104357 RepID=A0ABR3J4I6_9AGAR
MLQRNIDDILLPMANETKRTHIHRVYTPDPSNASRLLAVLAHLTALVLTHALCGLASFPLCVRSQLPNLVPCALLTGFLAFRSNLALASDTCERSSAIASALL